MIIDKDNKAKWKYDSISKSVPSEWIDNIPIQPGIKILWRISEMKKIGFIGLGNMGLPMANNISKAGIEVNAFDLSEKALIHAENLGMSLNKTLKVF